MQRNRQDPATQWLLVSGAVGAFGFVIVALAAGTVRPQYSPLYHHISALSLGEGGWIQVANFIVTGVLMLLCALGLRRALATGRGAVWGPILIGAFGLGLIAAGVFVQDAAFGYPPGAPAGIPETHTIHGTLHNVASLVVFGALPAACVVFFRRFLASRNRGWAAYSLLTGFAVPAFIVISSVALFRGGPAGLFQRLSVGAGWLWVGLLAIRLIGERRRIAVSGERAFEQPG
jgi:hypothetical protein